MRTRTKSRRNTSKGKKIAAVIVLLALVGGGVIFYMTQRDNDGGASKDASSQSDSLGQSRDINYDPPTQEEKDAGNIQKDQNLNRDETTGSGASSTANVIIVDANQYDDTVEVRGYISNVYADGTCTATLTRNGQQTVTRSTEAFKDATTTQCTPIDIPRSAFTQSGDWSLQLAYKSSTASGSATKQVSIK